MDEKTLQKVKKLQELLKQKEAIEKEISELISPEKVVVLPPGFSINIEVLKIVKEAGADGIAASDILVKLKQQHPSFGIDRKRVASALTYLKNVKKQILGLERGMYKIIEGQ